MAPCRWASDASSRGALDLDVTASAGGGAAVAQPLRELERRLVPATFVALVADPAAGAAAAGVIAPDELPRTADLDVAILAATRGERLLADADVLAHAGRTLVGATTVTTRR